MRQDELRRAPRVSVCCRVVVRERLGIWTAVTADIGARGCGVVTPKLPRLGSLLTMTLSSDLFAPELEVIAETVWATTDRLGVLFVETVVRGGALLPPEWLVQVIERGRAPGPEDLVARVTPVILRARPRQGALTPVHELVNDNVVSLPLGRR